MLVRVRVVRIRVSRVVVFMGFVPFCVLCGYF